MNDGHAVLSNVFDRECDLLPLESDPRAMIRDMDPTENLDQGRLPRAVLPDKAMNFAGKDRQIHVSENGDACETFGDISH
ncbi:hypothetical protein NLS1_31490 [Nocardioides sp. LS1]|nr:hypothetical protein NLS1_31490 [Nocardioides sp. LS1]